MLLIQAARDVKRVGDSSGALGAHLTPLTVLLSAVSAGLSAVSVAPPLIGIGAWRLQVAREQKRFERLWPPEAALDHDDMTHLKAITPSEYSTGLLALPGSSSLSGSSPIHPVPLHDTRRTFRNSVVSCNNQVCYAARKRIRRVSGLLPTMPVKAATSVSLTVG